MAKEMSSKFQPQEVEAGKYQWWVDSGVLPSKRRSKC